MYTVSYNARSCSAVPTVKNTTAQSTHTSLNPLKSNGNYSATLNNIKKLVHWQLMGGLLHLV